MLCLSDADFTFDKEKEEQYINFICEHTIPLGEKISTNCDALTHAINMGDFEATSMMNVLTFTLDYLTDVYFLKRTFNRFCRCTDTLPADVTGETVIGVAISQIDAFISQAEMGIHSLSDSLFGIRMMNKITANEFSTARKMIADIKELFDKHRELNWYGKI